MIAFAFAAEGLSVMQPIAYILHPFLIQYLRVLSTKYKTECSYPYIGKNFQFECVKLY